MTDIGHEIATGGLHTHMLGVVVDVDDHPAGVGIGQPAHVTAQRESRATRRPRLGGQVHFDGLTGGQGPLGGVPCLLVELTVAHQAELAGPGIDQDHVLVLVDDDNPGRRDGDDALEHLGDRQAGLGYFGSISMGRCAARVPHAQRRAHSKRRERSGRDEKGRCGGHAKSVRIR
ncbi:Uncharacterised protein [Mycobacteroides abscessus subsp. abscessus]|nr:Uncharacterised protein [Mycobacteroides abscessus subsp. abscessus]SIK86004.1 Uncharacterised protein [Mycobacteroides abscessus subsp. abscessus]